MALKKKNTTPNSKQQSTTYSCEVTTVVFESSSNPLEIKSIARSQVSDWERSSGKIGKLDVPELYGLQRTK